jgi:Cd2+/Zn2+-exporting ATPase
LADFLLREQEVEAVRLDPDSGKVAMATMGNVDVQTLHQKLIEVIGQHELELPEGAARKVARSLPDGFLVRDSKEGTILQKQTCETAPVFWKWREFDWPEGERLAESGEAEWKTLAVLAGLCGVGLVTGYVIEAFTAFPPIASLVCFVLAMLFGGWDAAVDVSKKIRHGEIDIHFLMLAVAVGASLVGAYGEGALLLFLFSTSSALEEYAMHRTHREITALLKAAPKTATLLGADGQTRTVAVERVEIGDRLLVRPGELFPVDGTVVKGRTATDESNLSGEALPVEKDVGDEVSSGTINLWGAVEVRVIRLASQSTLQKIIDLIRRAQRMKAPSQRFTDRFGVGYTYLVLGTCLAMFLIWTFGFGVPAFDSGDWGYSSFYRAMTLLVVMSPCALVLSIPSAILAAIAWGAKHGILFRGGAAIEKMAEIGVVALDKTGTLTTGDLSVSRIESFPEGREQEILELSYALERQSQHPIARAIVQYGRAQGLTAGEVTDFQSLTGKGVRGKYGEASTLLGRRELMEEGPLKDWIQTVPPTDLGETEIWVLSEDLIGRILLRDEVREDSRSVLDRLRTLGIRTVMLTGDRSHAAEAVGQKLGIDEIRAGLLPEQKVEAIRELSADGSKVAMVGDGVNDAPSLAAAYVSVAMGARGSDAALEQSEVILVNDRIENFLSAFRLSQRARRVIKQNLFISLGTVAVMALASLSGQVPLSLGVMAHEGSTVVVCLNSLRLLLRGSND